MKKVWVVFVLGLLLPRDGYATEQLSGKSGGSFFAVGYSSNPDATLAKRESCVQARIKLAEYVFGASYQISQNMFRSLGVVQHSQDIVANSEEIIFRSTSEKISQENEETRCEINYPELEAEIEKKRLSSVQEKSKIKFTEIGDSENVRSGEVEIITVPADVSVYIDNERWGTTPLRLSGKIPLGKHRLRLDHSSFKPIEEEFQLQELSKIRIEKILEREWGTVKLETIPTHAEIWVNDEMKGFTPKDVKIPAKQLAKLKMRHVGFDEYAQDIQLQRNETKSMKITLPSRSGLVSFNVVPAENVTIEIDKKTESYRPNEWIRVSAGDHEFKISAPGHSPKRISASITGEERTAFPTVQLSKAPVGSSDSEPTRAFSNLAVKVKSSKVAMIEINGPVQKFASGTHVIFDHIPSGIYSMQITVPGGDTYQNNIELDPGETKTIEKTMGVKNAPRKLVLGLPLEYSSGVKAGNRYALFQLGLSVETPLISVFSENDMGIEFRILLPGNSIRNSPDLTMNRQPEIKLGLPLYLNETFYLIPQWSSKIDFSQNAVGGSVGKKWWFIKSSSMVAGLDFRLGGQYYYKGYTSSQNQNLTTGLTFNLGW